VALVEQFAKETGLWADTLKDAEYERLLSFDLSTIGRNMAGHQTRMLAYQLRI
jgi:aconitate hydratase